MKGRLYEVGGGLTGPHTVPAGHWFGSVTQGPLTGSQGWVVHGPLLGSQAPWGGIWQLVDVAVGQMGKGWAVKPEPVLSWKIQPFMVPFAPVSPTVKSALPTRAHIWPGQLLWMPLVSDSWKKWPSTTQLPWPS